MRRIRLLVVHGEERVELMTIGGTRRRAERAMQAAALFCCTRVLSARFCRVSTRGHVAVRCEALLAGWLCAAESSSRSDREPQQQASGRAKPRLRSMLLLSMSSWSASMERREKEKRHVCTVDRGERSQTMNEEEARRESRTARDDSNVRATKERASAAWRVECSKRQWRQ